LADGPHRSSAPAAFDLAIIGAGPAGLTAGLYAARAGRSVVILEQLAPGGQAMNTWRVDNYPGLPEIHGADLMAKLEAQVRNFQVLIQNTQVTRIIPGPSHCLQTTEGEIAAGAVVIASGAVPRALGIPGEEHYRGRGVSYCATCDGAFFRNMPVAVIGGGNTALEEAEYLTRFASDVYLVHRREQFRADKLLQTQVLANPKIKVIAPYAPLAVQGVEQVKSLLLEHANSREKRTLDVEGVFVFVGSNPQTGFLAGLLEMDDRGYIITRPDLSTHVPGIFAAGDCRAHNVKQIVVAAGEGATAAVMADHYLRKHFA
jgi:thioredoxin reductase (NADPH)